MKQHFDCIIVGAGISGLTAAIYLKRANINVLLIEKEVVGGQINKTSNVENYPGFEQIDGPSLVMNIYDQVNKLQIPIKYDEVTNITKNKFFEIKTKKNEYTSTGVIVATGRKPNLLGLEGEEELVGKGISYCALCDGNFFKGKDICIVGGGNSAFEEGLYLAEICNKVIIINRSDTLRATEILIEKVKLKNNIEILYNSSISKVNSKDSLLDSVIVNGREIKCSGLFIYIGSTPSLDFARNLNLDITKNYINTDFNMRTKIKNFYACGDTIYKEVYQIVTAAADGATAAVSFIKDFEV